MCFDKMLLMYEYTWLFCYWLDYCQGICKSKNPFNRRLIWELRIETEHLQLALHKNTYYHTTDYCNIIIFKKKTVSRIKQNCIGISIFYNWSLPILKLNKGPTIPYKCLWAISTAVLFCTTKLLQRWLDYVGQDTVNFSYITLSC